MRRYALRDDQWERIKDLLPGREGHVGVTAKDNRLFVDAVLYDRPVLATGEDGVQATRIVDAIKRSAETGQPVDV